MCIHDHSCACVYTPTVSTFLTRKNSQFFLELLTGFEPSSFGSESDALPIEPPSFRASMFNLLVPYFDWQNCGLLVHNGSSKTIWCAPQSYSLAVTHFKEKKNLKKIPLTVDSFAKYYFTILTSASKLQKLAEQSADTFLFWFLFVSGFAHFNVDDPSLCVCECVYLSVCPSQAIPQKLLQSSLSNLA